MRPLLITAGATRNPLDAIRYLSAGSSGQTGVGLVRRLREAGLDATLLGSAEACLRGTELPQEIFGSTRDLMARMERWVRAHPDGVVVHAAAVGDYEAEPDASKIPSGQEELVLRLRPAPKILDRIQGWSAQAKVVSFKAAAPETSAESLVRIARRQLHRTGSSLVFANVLGRLDRDLLLVDAASDTWFSTRDAAVDALLSRVVDLARDAPGR